MTTHDSTTTALATVSALGVPASGKIIARLAADLERRPGPSPLVSMLRNFEKQRDEMNEAAPGSGVLMDNYIQQVRDSIAVAHSRLMNVATGPNPGFEPLLNAMCPGAYPSHAPGAQVPEDAEPFDGDAGGIIPNA